MIRRALIGALAAGLITVFTASTAAAAPPETTTTNQHGLVETFVDVIPTCDDSATAPYTITTTSNFVEHETVFADGRVHATFTQTGTFVAVPLNDPSLPSYTGKFTMWGNFNQNSDSVANSTFTFSIHGTGSDGSTFSVNLVQHFNQPPDGSVKEFFHCH
jgi:hypothetical protein